VGNALYLYTLVVSLSPFDGAQGVPEALEGSNHEHHRSSFDRLRTSECTKSALQNVVRTFRSAPTGRPKGLHDIGFCNAL